MRLPGYSAEASLSAARRFYSGVTNRSASDGRPTVVAQLSPCDPCDICGDGGNGGGQLPPTPCPARQRCCGAVIDGECIGRCWPKSRPCE